ncbi:MAG: signal peptidase I [Myxococcota bacterium]
MTESPEEGAAPVSAPSPRAVLDARRFAKDSKRTRNKHQRALKPAELERVDAAILGIDEGIGSGSSHELAKAVKHLEETMDDVLGFAKKSGARELLEALLVAFLIAGGLRGFVFEAFKIPSGSMIPTLEVGDQIFVNKLSFGVRVPFTTTWLLRFGQPRRGDVIVFLYPRDMEKDYIKRVVAIPGDKVRVDHREVLINGTPLVRGEPHALSYWEDAEPGQAVLSGMRRAYAFPEQCSGCSGRDPYTVLYSAESVERRSFPSVNELPGLDCADPFVTDKPECTVLPGYVFVMGDNRDYSSDGREWGGVPIDYIKGRAMFVWWSRGERAGVRWDRIGHPIE